jgi:DNA repair protein SbcD/Mre11
MRLGYFTDPHIRSDSPEGRTDDYRKAILDKMEEIGSIWEDQKVDYVLFGGDMFHTPDPPNSLVYDVMGILKLWNKDIYGVIGSHDYFGYQMRSLKRTAAGLLQKSDLIQWIGGEGQEKSVVLKHPNSTLGYSRVSLWGTPHTYWLCDDVKNLEATRVQTQDYETELQIQLVHGDLLDKHVPWQHALLRDVKTASQLILSGHYHPGWDHALTYPPLLEEFKVDGPKTMRTFINPGSIGRVENSGKPRIPRVCIIDIPEKFSSKFEISFVNLTHVERHPFVEKVAEEETQQDVGKLLSLMEDLETEDSIIDIKSALPKAAEQLGFPQDVVEKAFDILERVH